MLAAIPVIVTGGSAHAGCANAVGAAYHCSGVSNAESFSVNNADFSTLAAPPFSVNTNSANALRVDGLGHIRFTDVNASTLISTQGDGLEIISSGDLAGAPAFPGAVTVKTNGTVRGSAMGIHAENLGSGSIDITADGDVAGASENGIYARNAGLDVTVTTGAESTISGGRIGIHANNNGIGNTKVTANGEVNGLGDIGILAANTLRGVDVEVKTGSRSVVTGKRVGIDATGVGSGDLTISVSGDVTGTEDTGIMALANDLTDDLKITTEAGSSVTGGIRGIEAIFSGRGVFEITVKGEVTGTDSGEDPMGPKAGYGIFALNRGASPTTIKVESAGLVQGHVAGIRVISDDAQPIAITNYGEVRNISGDTSDIAVTTDGAETTLDNRGRLVGQVDFHKRRDTVKNSGTWNASGGTSQFGGGGDVVENSGMLIAADDTNLETTQLVGLRHFENSGLVTLVDGQAGDSLEILADRDDDALYEGVEGRLAVDAVLGAAGTGLSDELVIVDAATDGTTRIAVNLLDVVGGNAEGIPVVRVRLGEKLLAAPDEGMGIMAVGETSEEDFELENGPFNAGFFVWDLRLDEENNWHELFSAEPGAGALEFAAGITGAQDLWHQTTGLLLQRQADLRPLLDGTAVTPAADYGEPAPLAQVTPGFWFKGVGAWLTRDEGDGLTRLDREQTIYGGLGGLDFGSESGGEAWMFGLFGGYLVSDLDFDQTGSTWAYEGSTAGAYATYLNQAFYVDVVVKADLLDIDIDAGGLTPGSGDADTDLFNIGGVIDAGYKFGFGDGVFLEPQASLALVRTEIDDVDMFGGTVDFDDETSVRGRLGLRAGMDRVDSGGTVYSAGVTASLWQEFNDGNDVTIFSPGLPSEFGVADDPGGTVGDLSLGLAIAAPGGLSGFLRGNYQLAEDFEAVIGNAGMRFAW